MLSKRDRLCLLIVALLWFGAGAAEVALDALAYRAIEADKPQLVLDWEASMEAPALVETMALQLEPDPYREEIPLDRECQVALWEACEDSGVPVALALGLIEVESNFQPDAVSSEGCYGLCQLNAKYFPSDLDPTGNIRAGVGYLGELLERYKDTAAALTAYNAGYDTGSRIYANAVLAAAARWED